jgi:uncharacterized membrane protein
MGALALPTASQTDRLSGLVDMDSLRLNRLEAYLEGRVSKLYTPLLVMHVLAAVLGLGSTASVAIVAATARRHAVAMGASIWLSPLLRYSTLSLVTMLVTGVLLDFTAAGAFSSAWWFRGSVLLLITTGILNSLTRRMVRAVPKEEKREKLVLGRVQLLAYGMCALLAAITILMETKPF